MDPVTMAFMGTVITLISKYGLPAALQIIQAWKVEGEPTMDDIKRLHDLVPPPETYFEKQAS